jgi:hypothetical protein
LNCAPILVWKEEGGGSLDPILLNFLEKFTGFRKKIQVLVSDLLCFFLERKANHCSEFDFNEQDEETGNTALHYFAFSPDFSETQVAPLIPSIFLVELSSFFFQEDYVWTYQIRKGWW